MFLEFPPVSTAEWEAAVRLDLKGKDPASLGKILYTAEDAVASSDQPWPAQSWQIWTEVSDLSAHVLPADLTITQQIAEARHVPVGIDLVVPVGPTYFEEIAKFRALRRLRPENRLIARTSGSDSLPRTTTEAMAAIIGGCDALIVTPSGTDELAKRLALNTQLLLREESSFGLVADPSAGSWYIEALTAEYLK